MTNLSSQLSGKAITPLWIIALFVSLTEVVLGIAVVQTSSGIQIALTVFVLAFPLLIAGAFFFILWNRPYVLYPPTEFGSQTDVRQYVDAMQQNRTSPDNSKLYDDIQRTVQTTLLSSEVIDSLTKTLSANTSHVVKQEIQDILATTAEKTLETLRDESFIEVNTKTFLGNEGEILQLPYGEYSTVSSFLNHIYFSLKNVMAFTYGQSWILRDTKSERIFYDLGKNWADKHAAGKDNRTLKEVGLIAGMKLEVIAPRKLK